MRVHIIKMTRAVVSGIVNFGLGFFAKLLLEKAIKDWACFEGVVEFASRQGGYLINDRSGLSKVEEAEDESRENVDLQMIIRNEGQFLFCELGNHTLVENIVNKMKWIDGNG